MSSSQFQAKGRLYVTVIECKELANKELVGKMDPYVTLDITGSKEKHRTKTISGGHQNPKFNQSFIFNLEGKEDLFHANVYDRETLVSDDHVGRCDMGLDKIDITDKPKWYELRDRNNFTKQAGYICLSCKFEGTGWPGQTVITTAPTPAAAPSPSPTPAPAPAPASAPQPSPPQPQPQYVYAQPQVQPGFAPMYAPAHHTHQGSFIYTQAAPGQPLQPLVYGQPLQPLQPQPVPVMYGGPVPVPQPQVVYGAPAPSASPAPGPGPIPQGQVVYGAPVPMPGQQGIPPQMVYAVPPQGYPQAYYAQHSPPQQYR